MLQSCTGHLFTARFTDSAIQREIIPFFPIALPPSPSVFSALLFPIQLFLFIFSPCSLPLGISAQKKKIHTAGMILLRLREKDVQYTVLFWVPFCWQV